VASATSRHQKQGARKPQKSSGKLNKLSEIFEIG
jgi:hypothetical protein